MPTGCPVCVGGGVTIVAPATQVVRGEDNPVRNADVLVIVKGRVN